MRRVVVSRSCNVWCVVCGRLLVGVHIAVRGHEPIVHRLVYVVIDRSTYILWSTGLSTDANLPHYLIPPVVCRSLSSNSITNMSADVFSNNFALLHLYVRLFHNYPHFVFSKNVVKLEKLAESWLLRV